MLTRDSVRQYPRVSVTTAGDLPLSVGAACRYVRTQIGKRVSLRLTPEIRFFNDTSVDRGERVLALLNRVEQGSESEETSGDDDSEDGFFVLGEDDASDDAAPAEPAVPKVNRFLVGLDDSDEEEDDGQTGNFFTAAMFPDANPQMEDLQMAQKAALWDSDQGRKGAKKSAAKRKAAQKAAKQRR
jgi:hypothetical protein